jgi:hypothetical protein
MLERNPDKRITIPELKKETFFADIDWEKVARKEMNPPIDVSNFKIDYIEEGTVDTSENKFTDTDYTNINKDVNRYDNITFTTSNY